MFSGREVAPPSQGTQEWPKPQVRRRRAAATQGSAKVSSGADHAEPPGHQTDVQQVFPPDWAALPRASGSAQEELFPLVSVAHEFKTPLVVMVGYLGLLREGQLGPLTEKQVQVLKEMQESVTRLQKFLGDLLLLNTLRAGKDKVRLEASSLNEPLQEIFEYWAPLAGKKSLDYQFVPAAGNPDACLDSLKLQHIVSNLIENAIKWTPAGGRVMVTAQTCFWDRRNNQNRLLFNVDRKTNSKIENAVRIDVNDSGPGIPADHQQEIFMDFVQLPNTSSGGAGLGLAIARRLTAVLGGAIWVESHPGSGSKFSLLLPRRK